MNRAYMICGLLLLSASAFLLADCGGGGGGGGFFIPPAQNQPPTYNATGIWNVTETSGANTCGNAQGIIELYSVTVNHPDGSNSLTVSGEDTVTQQHYSYSGTISGSSLSYSGQLSDPDCTSLQATVNLTMSSETSMSGSANWTCYYQGGSCNGSNSVSAVKQGGTGNAPSGLTAQAVSSTSIVLGWADNSTNESGFSIERSLTSCSSGFSEIGTTAASIHGYTSSNHSPSQYNCYRVKAFGSGWTSGYSNTASATTMAVENYTLSVDKAGTGTGTVTASGISCGSDCSQSFSGGTSVTLTATASSGSSFVGWGGCDSASGGSCTVAMNRTRTVTATFNYAFSTGIVMTLPATSSTGSYTLSWVCTGLCSSNFNVQEDSDTSFASPVQWLTQNSSMSFTNKADGTYCYRVSLGGLGSYCQPKCITVARSTAAVLRIVNNTHYDMIDIRLNNVQKVAYPYGIAPGSSADVTFTSGGTVSYTLGVGFYNYDLSRDIWFTYTGSTNVTVGSTTTLTFPNPTIGQLLTGFSASRNWDGTYFCYNCSTLVHSARFTFTNSGGWTFYNDGVSQGTGSVTLVSWPDYSAIVQFKICPTCSIINLYYPFGTFSYNNGPPDWPLIEYVRQ